MKMWSTIEFRSVLEAIRWRTVVVLQRSTSYDLRSQTIMMWLLNLDADFFYASFDTLVYTVQTNASITRMTEWRSNMPYPQSGFASQKKLGEGWRTCSH
ncbi:hypothetical protein AVEN_13377-1 [Araneus ventricosus]|uniref:Uncharacterized protein n=1 Tax=Araneus ventricosus TaxID=182803 RepID=A0A4Y2UIY6_ARAVE|nr:hypothetical protein AVEN_13377-1 [Araneus ventricosus]